MSEKSAIDRAEAEQAIREIVGRHIRDKEKRERVIARLLMLAQRFRSGVRPL